MQIQVEVGELIARLNGERVSLIAREVVDCRGCITLAHFHEDWCCEHNEQMPHRFHRNIELSLSALAAHNLGIHLNHLSQDAFRQIRRRPV